MPGALEIRIRPSEVSSPKELDHSLGMLSFEERLSVHSPSDPVHFPDSFGRAQAGLRRFDSESVALNDRFEDFLKLGEKSPDEKPRGALVTQLVSKSTPVLSEDPVRIFRPILKFFQELYFRWKSAPPGFLFMGLGFLLSSGPQARYFEAEKRFEIPMRQGDPPFRLGGGSADLKADLILSDSPYLSPAQVELTRKGEDLVLHSLPSKYGNWVWQKQAWEEVKPGETWTLREGEYFVVGPVRRQNVPEDERAQFKSIGFHVEFGEGKDAFRLRPVDVAAPWMSSSFPYPLRLFPVFRKPPNLHFSPRLTWRERWDLWRSDGAEHLEQIWKIAERLERSGFPREARERYQEAIEIAEREVEKFQPRNPENRAQAGEFYPLLGKAFYRLGEYWDRRMNKDMALEFYDRALRYLESGAPTNQEARRWWKEAGAAMFRLHRFEAQILASLGNFAQAGEHYEAAADYARFEKNTEESVREYLQKAATAYAKASSNFAEAQKRVRAKLGELEKQKKGPFR